MSGSAKKRKKIDIVCSDSDTYKSKSSDHSIRADDSEVTIVKVRFASHSNSEKSEPSAEKPVRRTRFALRRKAKSATTSNRKKKSGSTNPVEMAIAAVVGAVMLSAIGIAIFSMNNSPSPDEGPDDNINIDGGGDPDFHPTLGGDFSVFEQRGKDYYIEVKVNDKYSGSCELSILGPGDQSPTSKKAKLEPKEDNVSTCSASLPYSTSAGNGYMIEAIVKSGEESVDLSRGVDL